MNATATYDALRHFADSWGLVAMGAAFLACAAWPFRPGADHANDEAAQIIFKDNDDG